MNILRILAWKNLKRNKKRTIATIIGIVVSVALISFILTLIYSFKYSMLETTKREFCSESKTEELYELKTILFSSS